MTISYKRVAAGFYTDAKIASLGQQPAHPTTLLQWLLTGPVLGVLPGCASIGRYGMAEQSGWEPSEIDDMIAPLCERGIVQFDARAPMIWMPNAIKFNAPRSPLNVTSWASDWRKLPQCVLKERAFHVLQAHCRYRDSNLTDAQKKDRKTSFLGAFEVAIEKPEPTPITNAEHRSEHSSTNVAGTKEKEKEKDIEQEQEDSPPARRSSGLPSNVTPLDCRAGGWS